MISTPIPANDRTASPRNINQASVEYDMKMGSASLFSRLCCGLSIAVLALSVSLDGSRSVRAEDADLKSSLQEMIVDPIMKTIQGLEQRLTNVEATVGSLAESFSSRLVVAQLLCVSDESGAQTCITKAQLDSLLIRIAHAESGQPSVIAAEAKTSPSEEVVEIVVAKDPAPAAESAGADEEKSVTEPEPEHTGTVQSASSGAAVVFYAEVEVIEEPASVEATPAEAPQPSDN
jgi:hypothetical protein